MTPEAMNTTPVTVLRRFGQLNRVGIRGRLAVLLVLAGGLRLYALSRDPLWFDEVMYLWLCRSFSWRTVAEVVPVEPLFCAALSLWAKWGLSELWVRLPSVIAGVLTTAVAYATGKRLGGTRAAECCGLLAAMAPMLVFYGRDGKMYAWLALVALLTLYFAIRFGDDGRLGNLLAYTVAAVALLYIHRLAPLWLAALNVPFLAAYVRSRRRMAEWFAAQLLTGVFFLPYLLAQWRYMDAMRDKSFWALTPTLSSLWITLLNLITGYTVSVTVRHGAVLLFALVVPLAFVPKASRRPATVLLVAPGLFILSVFVLSQLAGKSVYVERYLIGAAPPLLILAGLGAARIPIRVARLLVLLSIAGLFTIGLSDLYAGRLSPNRVDHEGVERAYDVRGMAKLIRENGQPNDEVWSLWWLAYPQLRWYTSGYTNYLIDTDGAVQKDMDQLATRSEAEAYGMFATEIDRRSACRGRVWLAVPEAGAFSFPGVNPAIFAWLSERGRLLQVRSFGGSRYLTSQVYLFDLGSRGAKRAQDAFPVASNPSMASAPAICDVVVTLGEAPAQGQTPGALELTAENLTARARTLSMETMSASAMWSAAGFVKADPELSQWRLAYRTCGGVVRTSLQLDGRGNTLSQDLLFRDVTLPPGDYGVFVETPTPRPVDSQGSRSAIEIAIGNDVLTVEVEHDLTDGWAWRRAGALRVAAAETKPITVCGVRGKELFSRICLVPAPAQGTPAPTPPVCTGALEVAPHDTQSSILAPAPRGADVHCTISDGVYDIQLCWPAS